jgi:large subunit ribosomal protein L27
MSKVKAGGSSKNVHDSPGQRLGVKVFGGSKVTNGAVIVRQVGESKRSGKGTVLGRDYTINASKDGIVKFVSRRVRLHSGRSVRRTEVTVE